MKIVLITTGGSIDKTYSTRASDFIVDHPAAENILCEAGSTADIELIPMMRKDSLEMTESDRHQICRAVEMAVADHIIITHGTDTMVETARALEKISCKVIVLTGAMEPAAFRSSDAQFNIGAAVAAVQILVPGVYICFNGRIFSSNNVRKNLETDQFEPAPGR